MYYIRYLGIVFEWSIQYLLKLIFAYENEHAPTDVAFHKILDSIYVYPVHTHVAVAQDIK